MSFPFIFLLLFSVLCSSGSGAYLLMTLTPVSSLTLCSISSFLVSLSLLKGSRLQVVKKSPTSLLYMQTQSMPWLSDPPDGSVMPETKGVLIPYHITVPRGSSFPFCISCEKAPSHILIYHYHMNKTYKIHLAF